MPTLVLCLVALAAPPSPPAVKLVSWAPHPGQARAFESGYRAHLGWHRDHLDPWTWRGWTVVSGPRVGAFLDGTFFHPWADLDAPVDPAGDAADNARNVEPTAELTGVGYFEVSATRGEPSCLDSPLLTVAWLEVGPGPEPTLPLDGPCAVLLRPVSGASEWVLLLGARQLSELPSHARALRAVTPRPARVRTETAKLREDLCYRPVSP